MNAHLRIAIGCAVIVVASLAAASAQDTVASARQLYGSAAYDEALGVLDRLKSSAPAGAPNVRDVEEYRALCLLALGRQVDAERAIEAVVLADPTFRPDAQSVSPRVLTAFVQVRRRLLPTIVQQRYVAAKAALDRQEAKVALAGFEEALALIDAPDPASAALEPPLSDLRTLVVGFRDLARAAATPPPPPPPAPEPPAPVTPASIAPAPIAPAPVAAATVPASPPAPTYYTADEPGVTLPVAVSQRVPTLPRTPLPVTARWGLLEVMISESGAVESARMARPIIGFYDAELVSAARHWKYRPALKDGQPVKFRWLMRISVNAQ